MSSELPTRHQTLAEAAWNHYAAHRLKTMARDADTDVPPHPRHYTYRLVAGAEDMVADHLIDPETLAALQRLPLPVIDTRGRWAGIALQELGEPMTETKTFHVGDILSITTGCIVSPRHMDGIYDILGWMVNESLMTHQLPRVSRECEAFLRETFPDLPTTTPEFDGPESVFAWLASVEAEHGETREVPRLPRIDHTPIDPITELKLMLPNVPIIVVSPPDQEGR